MTNPIHDPGIKKLIGHFRTQTAVAKLIGKTPQAVQKWPRVPQEYVLFFHIESGFALRPYDLRPDRYPDPSWVLDASIKSLATGTEQ